MAKGIILFDREDYFSFEKLETKKEINQNFEGILIDNSEEKEVRKIVDKVKGQKKIIAVQAYGNNFNRRVLETMKVDYLVFPEKVSKRDNLKQRDSGINQVTAKIAKEKGISFLINYSELRKLEGKARALVLSRIIQNLKVCRRAGAKIQIASFAKNSTEIVEKKGLQEFLLSLGASTNQAKDSINY